MLREYDTELQAAREERSEAIERELAEAERRAAALARLTAPVPVPPVFPQPIAALGYDEDYLDDSISAPLVSNSKGLGLGVETPLT